MGVSQYQCMGVTISLSVGQCEYNEASFEVGWLGISSRALSKALFRGAYLGSS